MIKLKLGRFEMIIWSSIQLNIFIMTYSSSDYLYYFNNCWDYICCRFGFFFFYFFFLFSFHFLFQKYTYIDVPHLPQKSNLCILIISSPLINYRSLFFIFFFLNCYCIVHTTNSSTYAKKIYKKQQQVW